MKIIKLLRVLCCVVSLLWLTRAYTDTPSIDEYKIKAGYLFNFTKFITWQADDSLTFNICILGNDPFGELINPIEQRTAFDRPIKLFRINTISKELLCHITYVSANVNYKLTDSKNNLTVGEDAGFISQGGMIALVKKEDRIKLQINLKKLQQSGLKISAKLLEVSEIVGDNND